MIHLDSPASITLPIETLYGLQIKREGKCNAHMLDSVCVHMCSAPDTPTSRPVTYILQFWQPKTHIEPMINQINPNPCTKL